MDEGIAVPVRAAGGGNFPDDSVNLSRAVWDLGDDELFSELLHRLSALTVLQRARQRMLGLVGGSVVALVVAAVLLSVHAGGPTPVALLLAGVALIALAASVRAWGEPGQDERRQSDVIALVRQVQLSREQRR